MHKGWIHVTPETGDTVPSSATTDGASLTASGVSTGLVGAQMVVAYAPGFLASIAVPLGYSVEDAKQISDAAQALLPASLIFGLVGFGLGTYNLINGLRKKKRYHDLSHRVEELLQADPSSRALLLAAGLQPPASTGTPGDPVTEPGHPHEHEHEHGPGPEQEHGHAHEHKSPGQAHAAGH